MNKKRTRKSIRLKDYDYSQSGMYFVTVCVNKWRSVFGKIKDREMVLNKYGKIVEDEWINTGNIRNYVENGIFCIMPNHIHGIIEITGHANVGATRRVAPTLKAGSLGAILGQFKSIATKKIKKLGLTDFKWQRNFYEHIIRNEKELKSIHDYITNNPLRWEFDKENPKGKPDKKENDFWKNFQNK
jgi:REP element-mobilizing transposase RayT